MMFGLLPFLEERGGLRAPYGGFSLLSLSLLIYLFIIEQQEHKGLSPMQNNDLGVFHSVPI